MLFVLILLETMVKIIIYFLTISQNYPERNKNWYILIKVSQNYHIFFFILSRKIH